MKSFFKNLAGKIRDKISLASSISLDYFIFFQRENNYLYMDWVYHLYDWAYFFFVIFIEKFYYMKSAFIYIKMYISLFKIWRNCSPCDCIGIFFSMVFHVARPKPSP